MTQWTLSPPLCPSPPFLEPANMRIWTLPFLAYYVVFLSKWGSVTQQDFVLQDRSLRLTSAAALGLHLPPSLRARLHHMNSVGGEWKREGSTLFDFDEIYTDWQTENIGCSSWHGRWESEHQSHRSGPQCPAGSQGLNISPFTWFISFPCKSGSGADCSLINLT